ncbi:unnamed protein product [Absidia cylindrospora]
MVGCYVSSLPVDAMKSLAGKENSCSCRTTPGTFKHLSSQRLNSGKKNSKMDCVALKKKYPDYYLWKSSLFQTDLYKQFEEQSLAVLNQESAVFNATQLMERAAPEFVTAMDAGFRALSASISQLTSTIQSLRSQREDDICKLTAFMADLGKISQVHFDSDQAMSSSVATLS